MLHNSDGMDTLRPTTYSADIVLVITIRMQEATPI